MRSKARLLVVVCLVALIIPGLPGPATAFHSAVLAEAVTFDGSVWRVTYDGARDPATVQALAQDLAAGGRLAYDAMVALNEAASGPCREVANPRTNWDFHARDADCVLEVVIEDDVQFTAQPLPGHDVRLRVDADLVSALQGQGSYTDPQLHDDATIARLTMAHELFHVLQWNINGLSPSWATWFEGTALAAVTLFDPEPEADDESRWHSQVARFVTHDFTPPIENFNTLGQRLIPGPSSVDACGYAYPYGLYWGYLAMHNGGAAVFKRLFEEIDALAPQASCATNLPFVIDATLASIGGSHINHAESLLGFGLAVYTKEFAWGAANGGPTFDFGQHLPDVWRPPEVSGPVAAATVQHTVGAWGLQYTTLPGIRQQITFEGAGGWSARAFVKAAGGAVTVTDLPNGVPTTVDASESSEAVLNLIRLSANVGKAQIALLPSPGP